MDAMDDQRGLSRWLLSAENSSLRCIRTPPGLTLCNRNHSASGPRIPDFSNPPIYPNNSIMSTPMSLYLFGDQSTLSKDDLGALLLMGGNPYLNTLADQAAFLLRKEIQSLSWSQREQFPSFANFQDLILIDASKPIHQALQSALSCVHHFALFLWYAHVHPPLLSTY